MLIGLYVPTIHLFIFRFPVFLGKTLSQLLRLSVASKIYNDACRAVLDNEVQAFDGVIGAFMCSFLLLFHFC
jgi:hypothetical protein